MKSPSVLESSRTHPCGHSGWTVIGGPLVWGQSGPDGLRYGKHGEVFPGFVLGEVDNFVGSSSLTLKFILIPVIDSHHSIHTPGVWSSGDFWRKGCLSTRRRKHRGQSGFHLHAFVIIIESLKLVGANFCGSLKIYRFMGM